jgi:hypothetical protein
VLKLVWKLFVVDCVVHFGFDFVSELKGRSLSGRIAAL